MVDADYGGWSEWSDDAGGWVWREGRIDELLRTPHDDTFFLAGCVSNQGTFYDRFDAVVLLRAPLDVMLERIQTRTNNEYGKDAGERSRIVDELAAVEPRLRATATHEVDATLPLEAVADALAAIAESSGDSKV